jgi:hypothetical protein
MHIGNRWQRFCGGIQLAGIALIAVLVSFFAASAKAAPFTHNFDALIADLQSRAAVLSNSTDKVGEKQFKAIEKILNIFNEPPVSEGADIKNLGTVGKALMKSFPTDFTPPGSSLFTNLQSAVTDFTGNVQALVSIVQTDIDEIATAPCKVKCQAQQSDAQKILDHAATASSFGTQANLIGSAWKEALKADATTTICAGTTSEGGRSRSDDSLTATSIGKNSIVNSP